MYPGGIVSQLLCEYFELVDKVFDSFNTIVHRLNTVCRLLYAVIQCVQLTITARQVAPETINTIPHFKNSQRRLSHLSPWSKPPPLIQNDAPQAPRTGAIGVERVGNGKRVSPSPEN